MPTFLWPAEDGWPYPDPEGEADAALAEDPADDDLLSVRIDGHLFDGLDPVERQVITAAFGLEGQPLRTIPQLHDELGLPSAQLEGAMGSGLAKLRAHLRG
jgi:DNA-directed RNA polymerase sigma subunit (sigma70/sigma32)